MKGIVACGHPQTAAAAEEILLEGGNAFDAIVAAHFASCVVEPVLASLGGGGYLMAHHRQHPPLVYDFFTHTPRRQCDRDAIDFYPVTVDFGGARQEFHIGLGSVATPGSIRGMYAIHRDFCSLPMSRLIQPAVLLAREGTVFNSFQAYIFKLVAPIYTATAEARQVYTGGRESLIADGECLRQPALAETLEALGREGEALFYQGELAERLVSLCRDRGGHLSREDLQGYRVIRRQPLELRYRGARVYTNPPPSSGGILMAFALNLMQEVDLDRLPWHGESHLQLLAEVMALTNKARVEAHLDSEEDGLSALLDKRLLQSYRQRLLKRSACLRGTTHISVMDSEGNSAAMTVSNGEGCGSLLPGSGIMLNNVLGEEDINPHGFHAWQPNQRMTSMMAPSLVETTATRTALGSGGSNRIRTALLQVISNLVDFDMTAKEAVDYPRMHLENGQLDIESSGHIPAGAGHYDRSQEGAVLKTLAEDYPGCKRWSTRNLFFGGVHLVQETDGDFFGAGDPRRGGIVVKVS